MQLFGNAEELLNFDEGGNIILDEELKYLLPKKDSALGRIHHAHDGAKNINVPSLDSLLENYKTRGEKTDDSMRLAGRYLRDVFRENKDNGNIRLFSPDETYSNHLNAVFEETSRAWQWPLKAWDKDLSKDGRVIEILSEHTLFGMLMGYTLTGRTGFFATYEAFAQIVASMADQYVKFVKVAKTVPFRKPVPALNVILSSLLERQDHNGFSHQNPSFIASMLDRDTELVNAYFPADKNVMLLTMQKVLGMKDSLNIIACGKKMHCTWLTPEEAKKQVNDGVMEWKFLSNDNPDVVVATAGDYITEEAVIGLKLFREIAPDVKIRFVNFFNLDLLAGADGKNEAQKMFEAILTPDKPLVFNYHGYIATIKKLLFGVISADRVIINGYEENGSTTSPFDMEARNGLSRFHLVKDLAESAVLSGVMTEEEKQNIFQKMDEKLKWEKDYIKENKVDPPSIKNWEL